MDIASVFEWFAQESKSIAEQAAEREQREKFAELALLWASAAQQCGAEQHRVSWSARTLLLTLDSKLAGAGKPPSKLQPPALRLTFRLMFGPAARRLGAVCAMTGAV